MNEIVSLIYKYKNQFFNISQFWQVTLKKAKKYYDTTLLSPIPYFPSMPDWLDGKQDVDDNRIAPQYFINL